MARLASGAARSFPIGNGQPLDLSNAIVNLIGREVTLQRKNSARTTWFDQYILYALLSDNEIAEHVVKVPAIHRYGAEARVKLSHSVVRAYNKHL